MQKLLHSPHIVEDPSSADVLVVPYFHALDCRMATTRSNLWARRCAHADLPFLLWRHLHHYSVATAARHMFLASIEPHNMHMSIVGQTWGASAWRSRVAGTIRTNVAFESSALHPALGPSAHPSLLVLALSLNKHDSLCAMVCAYLTHALAPYSFVFSAARS